MQLRQLRKIANLKQEDIAKDLNVDRTTVSKWETGEAMPPADKLIKMSKLFGCTVDELLGITGDSVSAG